MTTLCLTMIVRDEERVIRRCLDSARPYIDAWAVVDTGSLDGTREIIREVLGDLPGELIDRPWRDFAHNRNQALELARGRADFLLTLDADEVLTAEAGFVMPELEADAYLVRKRVAGSPITFLLPQLVRSALPWRWVGEVHEALVCEAPYRSAPLPGLLTVSRFDGARNADPTAKFLADAALLDRAVEERPDDARAWFYLAQSWRDAGRVVQALSAYRRRVELGGWEEEAWYARLQVAVLLERIGADRAMVSDAYLDAWQFRPARAEPLCELARYLRSAGEHQRAWLMAEQAAATPRPDDELLFLDESVYAWRALDELVLARYFTGRLDGAREAWERLVACEALPESERPRVLANRRWLWPEGGD